jgi:hypothetical protein
MPRLYRLLLFLSLTAWVTASPLAAQPKFSIRISPGTQLVRAGSAVIVNVSVTNNSNQDLNNSGSTNGMTGVDPNFQFAVRDKDGRAVPKKVYKHPELASGHSFNRTIKPGETMSEEQDISHLLDMTHPGQYMIQVSRHKSEKPQGGVLKSNRVTVVVSP